MALWFVLTAFIIIMVLGTWAALKWRDGPVKPVIFDAVIIALFGSALIITAGGGLDGLETLYPSGGSQWIVIYNETFTGSCDAWSGGTCNTSAGHYQSRNNFATITSNNTRIGSYPRIRVEYDLYLNRSANNFKVYWWENTTSSSDNHWVYTASGDTYSPKPEPYYTPSCSSVNALQENHHEFWLNSSAPDNESFYNVSGQCTQTYDSGSTVMNLHYGDFSNQDYLRFNTGSLNGYFYIDNVVVYCWDADPGCEAAAAGDSVLITKDDGNVTGLTDDDAIIKWVTDDASNTSVNYGTTVDLGTLSQTDDSVTSHSGTLDGLDYGTLYYYNVTSCTASLCNTTGPHNFTTYGQINITHNTPASGNVTQNETFTWNDTIVCDGGPAGAQCGNITGWLDPFVSDTTCSHFICGNDTYTGGGDLGGYTWSNITSILEQNYWANTHGWNQSQTFVNDSKTLLWFPWYVSGDDLSESNLKDTYTQSSFGVNGSWDTNTAVTDETSEHAIASIMNWSWTEITQFINYLDVCADLTSSHQSAGPWGTSWICSRDNGRVVKNDENSASDATARLAIAFFMAAQNPELTNDQRSLLGERAMNITKFAMQEEFVSGCFNSTVNTSADLCNWRLAGAAQAYGIAAIEQVGQQMFSGYHESDIAHLLAACAYSGNITYCERAADETHQFLHFVEFDNQGNTSAHFNYTTGGAHYYFICSSSGCVPATQSGSTQMDDADSPRLWETCHNVDYARLTYSRLGLGLPWEFQALDNYCDAWTERMGPTGNVATGGQVYANLTSACYRLDDSGGDCDSTGIIGLNSYRPAGWVSNMVGFLSNESYYNTFATGTLSTYNIADDVYSGDTGFGIYGQVRYIRSIRSATGFYDFLYTNQTFNYTGYTQGTGSNGTQGASEGGGGGESAKSGLVSTTRGTTPFYVLEANPQNSTSCLNSNLTDTDQCTIVWTVNATGGFGVEHTFFSYYSSEYSTQQNSANYLINISSTAAPVVGAGGVGLNITLCPNISNTQPLWYANVTRALNGRGGYDPVNKLYNESYILPLNNTLCGWTWKVNNTNTTSAKTVSFTTNISNSDRNWTFYVNHTMFNTTAKTYSVPASTVYYFNVSLNYTRLPVLQGEPSVNVTVVEA